MYYFLNILKFFVSLFKKNSITILRIDLKLCGIKKHLDFQHCQEDLI